MVGLGFARDCFGLEIEWFDLVLGRGFRFRAGDFLEFPAVI